MILFLTGRNGLPYTAGETWCFLHLGGGKKYVHISVHQSEWLGKYQHKVYLQNYNLVHLYFWTKWSVSVRSGIHNQKNPTAVKHGGGGSGLAGDKSELQRQLVQVVTSFLKIPLSKVSDCPPGGMTQSLYGLAWKWMDWRARAGRVRRSPKTPLQAAGWERRGSAGWPQLNSQLHLLYII